MLKELNRLDVKHPDMTDRDGNPIEDVNQIIAYGKALMAMRIADKSVKEDERTIDHYEGCGGQDDWITTYWTVILPDRTKVEYMDDNDCTIGCKEHTTHYSVTFVTGFTVSVQTQ